jgi:hypothetical protein
MDTYPKHIYTIKDKVQTRQPTQHKNKNGQRLHTLETKQEPLQNYSKTPTYELHTKQITQS